MLSFVELQRALDARTKNHFEKHTNTWTLGDWGCALAGEAGEACNFIKKIRRGDGQHRDGGNKVLVNDLGKELADTIMYCCLIASEVKIDLDSAIIQKFNEVSDRHNNPVKLIPCPPRLKSEPTDTQRALQPFLQASCINDLTRQWEHLLRTGMAKIPPERPSNEPKQTVSPAHNHHGSQTLHTPSP